MRRGDDDFEEEDELSKLRQSKQFSHHSIAFGRNNKKGDREADDERPTVVNDASVEYVATGDEADAMSQFLPTSFGKKAEKVDPNAALQATKRSTNELDKAASRPGPAKPGPARPGPARPTPTPTPASSDTTVGPPRPAARDFSDMVTGPPKPAATPATDSEDSGPAVGPPRPAARDFSDLIGPPRPPPDATADDSDDDDDDDEDDDSDDDDERGDGKRTKTSRMPQEQYDPAADIPTAYEIKLRGHIKPITAMSIDPSGARLLTGGSDYTVRFWDFGGMDAGLQSFRDIEPCGGHPIKALAFTNTGDKFLVASGSAQPKIFDRDGFEVCEFVKGDQYLSDMTNTKGHVSSITGAWWHPFNKDYCLTSSIDGTLRIWDVNNVTKQKYVIKAKSIRGVRTGVMCCAYGNNGDVIGAVGQDGSLQIWPGKGPFVKPEHIVREAHVPETDASCITFSRDGRTIITRGGDDTLKVWDLRNLQRGALITIEELPNYFAQTDCIFSPDEKFIITGTSIRKDQGNGLLVFFDKTTLQPVKQMGFEKSSVIRINWHKTLNQIFVGGSDAVVRVLYDPTASTRGAMMSVVRVPKSKSAADFEPTRPISNPHSLEIYRPEPTGKRKREKDRKDPIKSKKPDLPMQGPGRGVGGSYTSHLLKAIGHLKPVRDEDPREAILKYAQEAADNPVYFGAYQKTQPKPVFAEPDPNEEGEGK